MSFNQKKEPRKLISVVEAATRLCLNPTTIKQRKCGTEGLSHIRLESAGGKVCSKILLIEDEIIALLEKWIKDAEAANPMKRVDEAERRLRRVS